MSKELAKLFAAKFIARPDVKAIQNDDGSWKPHTTDGRYQSPMVPWRMEDLLAHIAGTQTFGHYLLGTDDSVKLFAFDIDWEKNGDPEKVSDPFQGYYTPLEGSDPIPYDAREAWQDRGHASRAYAKTQMKMLATKLMARITEDLDIQTIAAYSGGKGVHVYGLTGAIPASDAREGAAIVLESLGGFHATRGDNFFRTVDQSPSADYRNFTIEVFPKQSTLDGKNLGNLMRLPLGRNKKSTDPTFFIDMTTPMGVMKPLDPMRALTESPWSAS